MAETICIPKERYEFLVECERLVDCEFEEKFSKKFIKELKKSEEDYKEGRFVEVKSRKEREELFKSL